jgi:hypothetical protein
MAEMGADSIVTEKVFNQMSQSYWSLIVPRVQHWRLIESPVFIELPRISSRTVREITAVTAPVPLPEPLLGEPH